MKTNRIEALSDALFAIVLTILVLEIKIPVDLDENLVHGLLDLLPKFVSYILSFIVIGIFWIGHHNTFNFIKKTDRVFLWINIFFFMFISLIPFSASLLGEYWGNGIAINFYGINLIIVGLLMFTLWNYAIKNKLTNSLDKKFINSVNKRILIGPLFYFLGIALSFVNKDLGVLLFFIPVIIQILPASLDKLLK